MTPARWEINLPEMNFLISYPMQSGELWDHKHIGEKERLGTQRVMLCVYAYLCMQQQRKREAIRLRRNGGAVRGPREWLQEGVMGGEGAKVRGEVISLYLN